MNQTRDFEIISMPDKLASQCAQMMANSDPWKKVGRTFEDSLKNFVDPDYSQYILKIDNQLAGFLVLILNGMLGGGFIKSLFVKPEYQGSGYGAKLLEYGESKIFKQFANAYICVSSFNKNAQLLYQKCGFEIVGELTELIIPGHHEVLLRKSQGPTSLFKVCE
ncbi:MAG: GNAT family N-acetyltransferase [Kangiellaceae bacterium]|nr:GNAT family N-acetyltransferase [Kangiellaceae bacterium]